METIKEGAHFKYDGGVPVAVIVSNGTIRTPQVFRMTPASADELAEFMNVNRKERKKRTVKSAHEIVFPKFEIRPLSDPVAVIKGDKSSRP